MYGVFTAELLLKIVPQASAFVVKRVCSAPLHIKSYFFILNLFSSGSAILLSHNFYVHVGQENEQDLYYL